MVESPNSEVPQKNRMITILGPTASGKTARAVELARSFNGEIISADSRQVYRDMDLGTGKDLEEYQEIPYHLIDICEAGEKYNLHRYISDFHSAFKDIGERNKTPILCGGTGLYLESALSGILLPDVPENPELRRHLEKKTLDELTAILSGFKRLHNTTDVDTPKRAIRAIEIEEYYRNNPELAGKSDRKIAKPIDSVIIGIDIPREVRRERISKRLVDRLEAGMIEEVEKLLKRGIPPEDLIYYGLEYKYLTLYAIKKFSYQEMVNSLEIAIHQFAKRQMTWFRGMERRGFKINWLPYDLSSDEFQKSVETLL
ncbi:MAG: tRNA (adenosine(37)-N6)-dimethylallyltransferase MiaA [Muribaculaceae bacterium]|nr:tRNA (adenosine(37)-N6)-dimethylallyltransferase MiaA [Muribaculaceae bacterium]